MSRGTDPSLSPDTGDLDEVRRQADADARPERRLRDAEPPGRTQDVVQDGIEEDLRLGEADLADPDGPAEG